MRSFTGPAGKRHILPTRARSTAGILYMYGPTLRLAQLAAKLKLTLSSWPMSGGPRNPSSGLYARYPLFVETLLLRHPSLRERAFHLGFLFRRGDIISEK